MYYLNKIVGAFLNPLGIGLLFALLSLAALLIKKLRPFRSPSFSAALLVLSILWLWFWSTGAAGAWLGLSLEREFPPQQAESLPTAAAIIVLGGGVTAATNGCFYSDMANAADRVWHGARLFKAGKAPKVFVTCQGDIPLLVDFGVPREAISGPSGARNTEEEARFIARTIKSSGPSRPHVLLVTSAWHMRRAKLMFDRYATGVEIVPAPADHETIATLGGPLDFKYFVPDPVALGYNAYLFKEIVGYWGYRFLRR